MVGHAETKLEMINPTANVQPYKLKEPTSSFSILLWNF
jgi:hypothetical protein